jgi:hypothetical protein
MKEISPEDKKYRKIMKYVLITFSVMMLITLAVIRIEDVAAFCGKTWVFAAAVLKPIIFGVLFAVLLNPLCAAEVLRGIGQFFSGNHAYRFCHSSQLLLLGLFVSCIQFT